MPQGLLTKREAAQALRVSTRTINRWVADRRLKAIKVRQIFRVAPEEIERFKRANAIG